MVVSACYEPCNPYNMSNDECFRRVMRRVSGLQENTGAILAIISQLDKGNCFKVFELELCCL